MFGIKSNFAAAFRGRRMYLDHASATPVLPEVLEAMAQVSGVFANPGGLHADAVYAKRLLQHSRERIASQLACKPRELIFTSGLTEGNALAILGAARAIERVRRTLSGTHWIVSSIEHSSVLECFSEIERMGGHVSHVEPDQDGIVKPDSIEKVLKPETVFVSVGWANNEIGTVQPLGDIARVIRAYQKKHPSKNSGQVAPHILFHSDGGQGPLYLSPQVHTLGVDLLTLGSGKLYGPRGIGVLYTAVKAQLLPIVFGGGQERGLRSGTEDTALAVGFAEALDLISHERKAETKRVRELRDQLASGLAHIPHVVINGNLKHSLPHMLNVSLQGEKSGEYLALQLDRAHISLSTKSACREGEADSHVVKALRGPDWRAKNTLRFSLGRGTTAKDIKQTIGALIKLSPKKP